MQPTKPVLTVNIIRGPGSGYNTTFIAIGIVEDTTIAKQAYVTIDDCMRHITGRWGKQFTIIYNLPKGPLSNAT